MPTLTEEEYKKAIAALEKEATDASRAAWRFKYAMSRDYPKKHRVQSPAQALASHRNYMLRTLACIEGQMSFVDKAHEEVSKLNAMCSPLISTYIGEVYGGIEELKTRLTFEYDNALSTLKHRQQREK